MQLVKRIPEILGKTVVTPNVIVAEQCRKMAEIENGFSDEFEGIRVLTIGRLSEEKGQDIVPEVAAKLKENNLKFKWYLIGDGKLRKAIEEKSKALGVENEVVLLGTKTNPYPYLKQADIYVQTSIHEGFCITLGEAKVFGMPIVSTEFAGAHEQLDGVDKYFVVDRNADIIAETMLKIVKFDKDPF